MALFPAELIQELDSINYPQDSDAYIVLTVLPELHVSDDYAQQAAVAFLAQFPIPQ